MSEGGGGGGEERKWERRRGVEERSEFAYPPRRKM